MSRIRLLAVVALVVAVPGCADQAELVEATTVPVTTSTPTTSAVTTTLVVSSTVAETTPPPAIEVTLVERPEWGEVFAIQDVVGTIAVHRVGSSTIDVFNPERAADPKIPASTFKILNSLIILETGVLADVDVQVPWDGRDRGIPAWNQDHSLRSGIEVSAVWLYQQMARAVGAERMSEWVARAEYGNVDISGEIDRFWLSGDLRISALQQVDFLSRLAAGELPFSDHVVAAVRDILVRESGDGWAWSHKTGTSLSSTPDLGWLVGIADNAGESWVFALNIDLEVADVASQLDPEIRHRIARTILESEGALPRP